MKDLLKDSILNPNKEVPRWPFEKPAFTKNEQLKSMTVKPDPDGSIDEARAYLENNITDRKAKVVTRLNFQDETDVNADISFNHFFITDAKPDAKPKAITKGFYRYNAVDFTPDGKQIIFTSDIDSLQHPDRSLEGEIYIVNTDGSNQRRLFGAPGKTYGGPSVSPSENGWPFNMELLHL